MKKTIIALFALLVFLFLAACGGPKTPAGTDSSTAAASENAGKPTDAAETSVKTEAATARTEATTAEPKYRNGLRVIDFAYENPVGEVVYKVKSVSDVLGANPWRSTWKIETLPVFVNRYPVGHGGPLYTLTDAQIKAAQEAEKESVIALVGALGLKAESVSCGNDESGCYPYCKVTCGGITVTAGLTGQSIRFYPGQSLISGISDAVPGGSDSRSDAGNKLISLWNQLGGKLDITAPFKHPTADVRPGNNGLDYHIFDLSDDYREAVQNYSLYNASFSFGFSDGALMNIGFRNPDSFEKLGDYPVISADAARAKLLSGDYISTLTDFYLKDGRLSSGDIAGCELMYLTNLIGQRYFIPAYRFFVALDPDNKIVSEPGYVTYGEFWVPAVESEYINVIKP